MAQCLYKEEMMRESNFYHVEEKQKRSINRFMRKWCKIKSGSGWIEIMKWYALKGQYVFRSWTQKAKRKSKGFWLYKKNQKGSSSDSPSLHIAGSQEGTQRELSPYASLGICCLSPVEKETRVRWTLSSDPAWQN